jgi:hypothetical protein
MDVGWARKGASDMVVELIEFSSMENQNARQEVPLANPRFIFPFTSDLGRIGAGVTPGSV